MRKVLLSLFIIVFTWITLKAQIVNHSISELPKSYYKYPNVKEKKLLCVQSVFTRIYVNDSTNTVLKDSANTFAQMLWDAVQNGYLNSYRVEHTFPNNFDSLVDMEEALLNMGGGREEVYVMDEYGEYSTQELERVVDIQEIKSFIINELRFYDREKNIVSTRIIGIAPVRHFYRYDDEEEVFFRITYFLYYPEVREVLSKYDKFIEFDNFLTNGQYESEVLKDYYTDVYENEIEFKDIYPLPLSIALEEAAKHHEKKTVNYAAINKKSTQVLHSVINVDEVKCAKYVYKVISDTVAENLPLFFPHNGPYQKYELFSFADVFIELIEEGKLSIYEVGAQPGSELKRKMSLQDFYRKTGNTNDTVWYYDENGMEVEALIGGYHKKELIKEYVIKELQFYNSSEKVIASRPVAICPKIVKYPDEYYNWDYLPSYPIGWLDFLEMKKYLKDYYCYRKDTGKIYNFDEFFTDSYYQGEVNFYRMNDELGEEFNIDTVYSIFPCRLDEALKLAAKYPERDEKGNPVCSKYEFKEPSVKVKKQFVENEQKVSFKLMDLRQQENVALYLPIEGEMHQFMSLADVIYRFVKTGKARVYSLGDENWDANNQTEISLQEMEKLMGYDTVELEIMDPETGEIFTQLYVEEVDINQIKEFILKIAYSQNEAGEEIQQIVALCPIRYLLDEEIWVERPWKTFWVDMKDIAKELTKYYVFETKSCEYISLYEFLTQYPIKLTEPLEFTEY